MGSNVTTKLDERYIILQFFRPITPFLSINGLKCIDKLKWELDFPHFFHDEQNDYRTANNKTMNVSCSSREGRNIKVVR